MSEKVRIPFDFVPRAAEDLDRLVAELGAASRAEVVRRALALFDRSLTCAKSGGKVIFKDADGKETELLFI